MTIGQGSAALPVAGLGYPPPAGIKGHETPFPASRLDAPAPFPANRISDVVSCGCGRVAIPGAACCGAPHCDLCLDKHVVAVHGWWWIDTGQMQLVRLADGATWPIEDVPALMEIPCDLAKVDTWLRKQRDRD